MTTCIKGALTKKVRAEDSSSSAETVTTPDVVTIYVNPSCSCGPFLDQRKLKSSPTLIGPSNFPEVLNQFLSILKSCAREEAAADLSSILLNYGGPNKKFEEPADFWSEVADLIGALSCCDNFVGGGEVTCSVCREKPSGSRKRNMTDATTTPTTTTNNAEAATIAPSGGLPQKIPKRPSAPEPQKRAVMTEKMKGSEEVNKDPGEWTVEDVIRQITTIDRNMDVHADVFRKHEIDGKAMLLLNSDMMMKYMGLKLGPALKICNIISKFKSPSKRFSNGGGGGN